MATTPVPYGIIVSRWFNHRRGIALGLMMAGLGAGAIVMPPVAQRLIASFGWRGAFAVVGCMVLLIPMPIVGRFFKEDPRQMGVLPDGARKAATATSAPGHLEGLTWHEIWHTRAFWLMLTAFFLLATTVHACVIHMPELLHDRGVSATSAALASSIFGLALMVGRVGSGYLLDLYFAPCVALFVFLQAALGIVLLGSGAAGPIALIGAFSVGLAMGAEVDMIAYLMSRYFGLRALGTAFGFGFGAFVLAGGLGPLLMGVGFDRTGSYRIPLAGFFAAAIVAAALVSRLGPYRYAAISTDEDEDHPRAAA